ncbi:hypothetical protein BDR22DRAFT_862908 [Usnea florida]
MIDLNVPWILCRNLPHKKALAYHVDADPFDCMMSHFPAHGEWKADRAREISRRRTCRPPRPLYRTSSSTKQWHTYRLSGWRRNQVFSTSRYSLRYRSCHV